MRSLRWLGAAGVILFLVAPQVLASPRGDGRMQRNPNLHRAAAIIDNSARMNANNLDMVVTNHGSLAYDLITGNAGLIYPKGSTKTAVFAAGLWIGAKVAGETRATVGEYSQEFVPGPMAGGTFQADQPTYKCYRIDRGNTSSSDYLSWPVGDGAPTDSLGRPLLLGDATIWSVFNDADPGFHTNEAGTTPPLGVEVQQTVFAFNRAGPLGNTIFVKWKIINKGANTLDSTYVSVWSDPDLGGATDDIVGCDTTRSLGYCYNATNGDTQYGNRPPAVGYDFFRGPIVQVSPGVYDTLGMVSFNKYINGTDPSSQTETYNYMRGLHADGSVVHAFDDPLQPVTTFQVSGDPVTGTGWLDSNPADRRLMLSSGPFTMAPGDSQEVVTAIIIGQGTDRLASVADLKNKDDLAQIVFDLNFDIPSPPPAPTVYVQPLDKGVRLVWGSEPVGDVQQNTKLNQEFHFEGIRVWQLASRGADAQPTVIATLDESNGVTNIYSDEFNPAVGTSERTLKAAGTDGGVQFSIDITGDRIRGGTLINNKDYYFAVTAYSYDVNNTAPYFVGGVQIGTVTEMLESARNPIAASPRTSSAVFAVDAAQTAGNPYGGSVSAQQVVQNDITGHRYRVLFDDSERWKLIDVTAGDTLLTNQTNVSGDFDFPLVDGFMPRVAAPRGVAALGEINADSSITDLTPTNTDRTATWHFSDFGGLDGFTPFFGQPDNHDYEIRFLPDTTQYAWTYGSGEVSFVATFKVPIEVYDLGFHTADDPSDDVKMSVMARDRNLPGPAPDGRWDWKDRFYIRRIPYNSVDWDTTAGAPNPITKSTDYVADGSDQVIGNFQPMLDNTSFVGEWPPTTRIRVYGRRFSAVDEFEFQTQPVGSVAGTVVGTSMKKILAVPNPYYAHSQYELTQFDRVMKFTNIPASRKVTIRIFNLAGDLVRTLTRVATTADQMAVATMSWNLNTDRNLPVASGVYIYRVDVDGVGSKTDRIAIFIEQERLDNF